MIKLLEDLNSRVTAQAPNLLSNVLLQAVSGTSQSDLGPLTPADRQHDAPKAGCQGSTALPEPSGARRPTGPGRRNDAIGKGQELLTLPMSRTRLGPPLHFHKPCRTLQAVHAWRSVVLAVSKAIMSMH